MSRQDTKEANEEEDKTVGNVGKVVIGGSKGFNTKGLQFAPDPHLFLPHINRFALGLFTNYKMRLFRT